MSFGRHLYAKVALAVVAFLLLLDAILLAAGLVTLESARPLAIGAGCALVGAVAGELVERGQKADGTAGVLAWIGLPVAVGATLLSLPFFAVAVYPPLQEFLIRGGVEIRFIAEPPAVEFLFPNPMRSEGSNVTLDGRPVAAQNLEWRGARSLWIHLDTPDDPRPRRAGFNVLPSVPPLREFSGQTVPPQHLDLPGR